MGLVWRKTVPRLVVLVGYWCSRSFWRAGSTIRGQNHVHVHPLHGSSVHYRDYSPWVLLSAKTGESVLKGNSYTRWPTGRFVHIGNSSFYTAAKGTWCQLQFKICPECSKWCQWPQPPLANCHPRGTVSNCPQPAVQSGRKVLQLSSRSHKCLATSSDLPTWGGVMIDPTLCWNTCPNPAFSQTNWVNVLVEWGGNLLREKKPIFSKAMQGA